MVSQFAYFQFMMETSKKNLFGWAKDGPKAKLIGIFTKLSFQLLLGLVLSLITIHVVVFSPENPSCRLLLESETNVTSAHLKSVKNHMTITVVCASVLHHAT